MFLFFLCRQGLLAGQAGPINIPSIPHQYHHHSYQPQSPQKLLKLSPRPSSSYPYPSPSSASPPALLALSVGKAPSSPSRRLRGENKKCRKVYGMEHREQWCTQCKWKKACSRFGDWRSYRTLASAPFNRSQTWSTMLFFKVFDARGVELCDTRVGLVISTRSHI